MKLLENTLYKLKGKVIAAALLALATTSANAGLIEVNGIKFDDEATILKSDIYLNSSSGQGVGYITSITDDRNRALWSPCLPITCENSVLPEDIKQLLKTVSKELNFTVSISDSDIYLDLYVNSYGTFQATGDYEADSKKIISPNDLFLSLTGTSRSNDGWFLSVVGGDVGEEKYGFNNIESERDMFFSYSKTTGLRPSKSTGDVSKTYDVIGTANFNTVPEPTSLALLGLGLAGIGFARKKRTS